MIHLEFLSESEMDVILQPELRQFRQTVNKEIIEQNVYDELWKIGRFFHQMGEYKMAANYYLKSLQQLLKVPKQKNKELLF